MADANLNYLRPLFQLGLDLLGDEDDENFDGSFGLGHIDEGSPLELDDHDLDGYWVSMVVSGAISAALDHVLTMHTIVVKGEEVTNNAMWTLLRGTLEPASTALWLLNAGSRSLRRERALRIWHYESKERSKWESDTGWEPGVHGKTGAQRAVDLVDLAKHLKLRPAQVASALNYADLVADAARAIGHDPAKARGLWREASGFAHGRSWVVLQRSSLENAELINGGVGGWYTLDETHHQVVAELTFQVLNRAIHLYAELADAKTGSAP